jgi:hypothetical protein
MPVKAYAVGCKKKAQIVSGIKTVRRLLPNGNIVTFIIGKTKKCGTASVIVENRKPAACKKAGSARGKSGRCASK